MGSNKLISAIVIILAVIAASFLIGRCSCDCPEPVISETIRIDTMLVETYTEPDTITVTKPKIIFRADTVVDSTVIIKYRDTAWTASDEVINSKNDTVQTDFLYPELIFKHRFFYSRDTSKVITIFKDKSIVKNRPWWEIPASILGGIAVGYMFGQSNRGL